MQRSTDNKFLLPRNVSIHLDFQWEVPYSLSTTVRTYSDCPNPSHSGDNKHIPCTGESAQCEVFFTFSKSMW